MSEPMPDDVADYLRRNPDFLRRHPELLAVLAPPGRDEGGVVDLQRVMVERARQNNSELREALQHVLEIGEDNQTGMSRVHDAALAVIGVRRFAHLAAIVAGAWPERLGCDGAALAFETRREALPVAPGLAALAPGRVDALTRGGATRLAGGLDRGPSDVFGAAANMVASQALLRLVPGPSRPPGLLALSSHDPEYYQDGQGTELLAFLARTISAQLPALIDPPEAL